MASMQHYENHHDLIAAIKHSDLKDGEVVIRLNGHTFRGNLTKITTEMSANSLTTFALEGIIR